jgi:hypothetical protein
MLWCTGMFLRFMHLLRCMHLCKQGCGRFWGALEDARSSSRCIACIPVQSDVMMMNRQDLLALQLLWVVSVLKASSEPALLSQHLPIYDGRDLRGPMLCVCGVGERGVRMGEYVCRV